MERDLPLPMSSNLLLSVCFQVLCYIVVFRAKRHRFNSLTAPSYLR